MAATQFLIKKFIVRSLFFIGAIFLALLASQAMRIYFYSGKTDYLTVPFQRDFPDSNLKILFLGDSTALGTGAKDNTESVAGWFGRDFQTADLSLTLL